MRAGAALGRCLGLYVLWLALIGLDPADMAAGVVASALATWASLALLPPSRRRCSVLSLAGLVLRYPGQAFAAGFDVARRALSPWRSVSPGFVRLPSRLPEGLASDAFLTFASLLPGTLPVGRDKDGTLIVHCLDTSLPHAALLARDEARFIAAIGGRADG